MQHVISLSDAYVQVLMGSRLGVNEKQPTSLEIEVNTKELS